MLGTGCVLLASQSVGNLAVVGEVLSDGPISAGSTGDRRPEHGASRSRGLASALVPVAGLMWWSTNVAFYVTGALEIGWGHVYRAWATGLILLPAWISEIVFGPGLFLVVLAATIWFFIRSRNAATVASAIALGGLVAIRLDILGEVFAATGMVTVLLWLPFVGGLVTLRGWSGARSIARDILRCTLVVSVLVLISWWLWPPSPHAVYSALR